MRKTLATLAALLASTAAHAYTISVTEVTPSTDLSGFGTFGQFGDTTGAGTYANPFITPNGDSYWGNGYILPAGFSMSGVAAAPSATNRYMAVGPVDAIGNENITLAKSVTSLTMLWGSLDSYNTLELGEGADTAIILGAGLQQSFGAYGDVIVTVSDLPLFDRVQIHSLSPAFEFQLQGSSTTPVPEASTWAMMFMGFAGLGYTAFARRKHCNLRIS